MAEVTSTHAKVSAKSDTADATLVQPSDWNEDHVFGSGTKGDLLYRDTAATNGASWLASVAAGQVLRSGGAGSAPVWGDVDLTAEVSGILPCANGGTGLSSYAVGDLLYASGATTLAKLADVAVGQVLVSGGVGTAPVWSATPTVRTMTAGDSGVTSTATLGTELVTNGTFDTDLSSWSYGGGSDWAHNTASAKHATGNTTALSQNITVSNAGVYHVTFAIAGRTAGDVAVTVGTVQAINTPASNNFSSNTTYYRTVVANASGAVALAFTPSSTFDGRIDTVSVKRITTGTCTALYTAKNASAAAVFEVRGSAATSMGVGINALASDLGTGSANTGIGSGSLTAVTNGSTNCGLGYRTLYATRDGVGNTAAGYVALTALTTGIYNCAYGSQSMTAATTGYNNDATGVLSLGALTTGYNNCGHGYQAGSNLTTGAANVFLGYNSGRTHANGSTALTDPENSVYIGATCRGYDNSDENAIVIGYGAIGAGANKAVLGNASITDVYFGSTTGAAKIHASALDITGATQLTVGASGAASTLPAVPSGYATFYVAGVAYVTPFYAAS
jgi:hypothetical protein